MFDNVMLVAGGKVAYFGKGSSVLDVFSLAGFHCHPHYNPVDFIVEKLNESNETETRIVEAFQKTKTDYVTSDVAKCLYTCADLEKARYKRRIPSLFNILKNSPRILTKKRMSAPAIKTFKKSQSFANVRRASIIDEEEAENDHGKNDEAAENEESHENQSSIPSHEAEPYSQRMHKVHSCSEIEFSKGKDTRRRKLMDINGSANGSVVLHDVHEQQEDDDDGASSIDVKVPDDSRDDDSTLSQMSIDIFCTSSSKWSSGALTRSSSTTVSIYDATEDGKSGALSEADMELYLDPNNKWPAGFWTQYTTLTQRTVRQARLRIWSRVAIIKCMFMAILQGLLWFQLSRSEETIYDRMGLVFFHVVFLCFLAVMDAILSFPVERQIIKRERSAGSYRLSSYYIAKMTSEVPLYLVLPFVMFNIVYWFAGLATEPEAYFMSLLLLILVCIAAHSAGSCIGTGVEKTELAMAVGLGVQLFAYVTGGFLSRHLPVWISWMRIFSWVTYGYHGFIYAQFAYGYKNKLSCLPANQTVFKECMYYGNTTSVSTSITGNQVLAHYDMDSPIWIDIFALLVFIFVLRLAAYLIMRFLQNPHKGE